jgi:hypothetical protein
MRAFHCLTSRSFFHLFPNLVGGLDDRRRCLSQLRVRLAPVLMLVARTVHFCVAFSQVRYSKGNLTYSILIGQAAAVALSKAKLL